jgi:hypothetical protein
LIIFVKGVVWFLGGKQPPAAKNSLLGSYVTAWVERNSGLHSECSAGEWSLSLDPLGWPGLESRQHYRRLCRGEGFSGTGKD